jgi:hypothetical protein
MHTRGDSCRLLFSREQASGRFSRKLLGTGGTKQQRGCESDGILPSQPMGDNGSITSALHQTAEQFHILVDSVEEYAIYLLDPNGIVVTWNTGAQKIKG